MTIPKFEPQQSENFRNLPTFTPSLQDGSARALTALAGAMDGIGNQALALHRQRTAAMAELAGQQAGGEDGFDPATLPDPTTVAGSQFRKGAVESFGARLQTDFTKFVNDRVATYESQSPYEQDPAQLAGQLRAYVEETAVNLPPELQSGYQRLAIATVEPLVQRATVHHAGVLYQQQVQDKTAAAELLAEQLTTQSSYLLPQTEAEHQAADVALLQLNAGIDAMEWKTPNERLQLKLKFATTREAAIEKAQFGQMVTGIYTDFEKAPDKAQFMDGFVNGGWQQRGLSFEESIEVTNKLQARQDDIEAAEKGLVPQLNWNQQVEMSAEKKLLDDRIDNGEATQEDIQGFVNKWGQALSPSEVGTMSSTLQIKREEKRRTQEAVNAFMAGTGPASSDEVQAYSQVMGELWQGAGRVNPAPGAAVTGQFGEGRPGHTHSGIDYALPKGSPAVASAAGTVTFAGQKGGYGNVVIVSHGNGVESYYAHADALKVKVGQKVEAGQPVIAVGSTGNSTGPHLHYEVRVNGKPVNPATVAMGGDKGQLLETMEQVAMKRGVVASPYAQYIQAGVKGDWKAQSEAATRWAKLDRNGVEVPGLSKWDETKLASIAHNLSLGMEPQNAVLDAQQQAEFAKATPRANDQKALETLKKDPANALELVFGNTGFFGLGASSPVIPMAGGFRNRAEAEWFETLEDYKVSTNGNMAVARQLAAKDFKKRYGVSKVVGRGQVMLHPPETSYSVYRNPDQDAAWIGKQLTQTLANYGYKQPLQDVVLITDDITRYQAKQGKPTYRVFVKNAYGAFEPVLKDGTPRRFAPSPDAEIKAHRSALAKEETNAMTIATATRTKAGQGKAPLRGGISTFTPVGMAPLGL